MDNTKKEHEIKKQLIYTLAYYGAKNAKLSSRRQKKLERWILPYTFTDLNFNGPLTIHDIREFIDRWENVDLNEKDSESYYVDKNSQGDASLWEKYKWEIIIIGMAIILWLFK